MKNLLLAIEAKGLQQGWLKGGSSNNFGGVSNGQIYDGDGNTGASATHPLKTTALKAKAIVDFQCVAVDGSWGVHNSKYIQALLTNALAAL